MKKEIIFIFTGSFILIGAFFIYLLDKEFLYLPEYFSTIFILSYVLIIFIFSIYILVNIFINLLKISRKQILMRIFKFLIYFILFSIASYTINTFLKPSANEDYSFLFLSFTTAFTLCFFDLLFDINQSK